MHDDTTPIRFNPGKNGYFRDDTKTRPTGSAGGKDFGKLMSKNGNDSQAGTGRKQVKSDDDEEEGSEALTVVDEEVSLPEAPVSVFDMSKTTAPKTRKPFSAEAKGESADSVAEGKQDSSAAPIKGKNSAKDDNGAIDADEHVPVEPEHIGLGQEVPKKAPPARPFDLIASATREVSMDEKTPDQKTKSPSRFSREQPDLASVNLMASSQPNANINLNLSDKEQPVAPVKSIQELINQMVREVQSMEAEGKTETTVTLNHPPIFEGAKLIVTGFDSARGEFNISFEHLTQAAQNLLNAQDNRASLMSALEQKGYHIHMVSATTIDEQRLFTANVDESRQDRNRDRDEDQQGGRGRQDQEEEG